MDSKLVQFLLKYTSGTSPSNSTKPFTVKFFKIREQSLKDGMLTIIKLSKGSFGASLTANKSNMAENPEKQTAWVCRLDQYPPRILNPNLKFTQKICLKFQFGERNFARK